MMQCAAGHGRLRKKQLPQKFVCNSLLQAASAVRRCGYVFHLTREEWGATPRRRRSSASCDSLRDTPLDTSLTLLPFRVLVLGQSRIMEACGLREISGHEATTWRLWITDSIRRLGTWRFLRHFLVCKVRFAIGTVEANVTSASAASYCHVQ